MDVTFLTNSIKKYIKKSTTHKRIERTQMNNAVFNLTTQTINCYNLTICKQFRIWFVPMFTIYSFITWLTLPQAIHNASSDISSK